MHARGFTLIELLVALAILAVVASVLVVSTSGAGNEPRLRREAERLQARIDAACERAELSGRDLGLHLGEGSYAFSKRRGEDFDLQVEAPLAPYQLPADIRLALDEPELGPVVSERPLMLCFSSGERTSLMLQLLAGANDPRYRLLIESAGSSRLQRRLPDSREWLDWKYAP